MGRGIRLSNSAPVPALREVGLKEKPFPPTSAHGNLTKVRASVWMMVAATGEPLAAGTGRSMLVIDVRHQGGTNAL